MGRRTAVARAGPPGRAGRAGVRRPRPARRARPAHPAPGGRPHRAVPDRLGQRPGPRALPAAVQPARARTRSSCSTAPPTAPRASCSSTGGTRPACCRSTRTRCCAGGWTRRTTGAWGGMRRIATRAARSWSPTCSPRCAGPGRCRPARSRSPTAAGRGGPGRGGTGRRSSARSSTCSGPARSRRRAGAGSSGCTTSPSASCPAAVLAAPAPDRADAQRELLRRAARSLGVATVRDLRDYYRLVAGRREGRASAALVEAGELVPVAGRGLAAPGAT